MSGQAILNHLDENDKIIHGDCNTAVELFLEDEEYYQMVLTLDFPEPHIQEKAEFYLWHHNKDEDSKIIATVFESAVKLAENDLLIHFRLFDENIGNPRKFLGVARLHGVLPHNIKEVPFFDLSWSVENLQKDEPIIESRSLNICMIGKIQLNYLSISPFILSSSSGNCDLRRDSQKDCLLRFHYAFPELQINEIESIPISGVNFQGDGYYAQWFICVQLSAEELLMGFTIFDDRDNYPDTIGAFARLRGEIPSTIERKVLM